MATEAEKAEIDCINFGLVQKDNMALTPEFLKFCVNSNASKTYTIESTEVFVMDYLRSKGVSLDTQRIRDMAALVYSVVLLIQKENLNDAVDKASSN